MLLLGRERAAAAAAGEAAAAALLVLAAKDLAQQALALVAGPAARRQLRRERAALVAAGAGAAGARLLVRLQLARQLGVLVGLVGGAGAGAAAGRGGRQGRRGRGGLLLKGVLLDVAGRRRRFARGVAGRRILGRREGRGGLGRLVPLGLLGYRVDVEPESRLCQFWNIHE